MHFQPPTIRKFLRESLVTVTPLTLDDEGIANLKKQLQTWFGRVEELNLSWYVGKDRSSWGSLARDLCGIGIKHSRYGGYGYGGFALGLDAENKLHVAYRWNTPPHPVGNLEELFAFLRLCQERVVRMTGQEARRTKVRKLRSTAIQAQVQELARTYQFDFHVTENVVNVDLVVRFEGGQVVEVSIPLARFDEVLPQIEAMLPQLRELVKAGIAATIRPKQVRRLRGAWVLHKDLGQDAALDSDEDPC
jgi:hypothetical protein